MISKDHLFLDKANIQKLYKKALEEMKTNNFIKQNSAGTIFRIDENDRFHHETKPAIINPTKNFSNLMWFKNNKNDRDNAPAIIEKDKRILTWYKRGKEHRIGGFSTINCKENIYELNIDGHILKDSIKYLKASKEWIQTDPYHELSSHDKLDILEILDKKFSIGYFDKNLWKDGHFIG